MQSFSKMAALLTPMLKTTKLSKLLVPKASRADNNEDIGGVGIADETVVHLSKSKKSKNLSKKSKNDKSKIPTCTNLWVAGEPIFLTPGAKEVFTKLRQAFTKALIPWYFDLECHIQIQTNASGYAIGRIPSQLLPYQLTSKHLGDYPTFN